jgi:HK97 family phage prohead protease
MANKMQLAALSHLDCEVRFASPGDDGVLTGTAIAFDMLDQHGTTFDKRAFNLDGHRIPLLWGHDPNEVIGSVRAINADTSGLQIQARLNLDTQRAREARSLLQAGDISGLSIGFRRLADEPRKGGTRHITKAELREVSIVAFPSNPGSHVSAVRSHSSGLAGFTEAVLALSNHLRKGSN